MAAFQESVSVQSSTRATPSAARLRTPRGPTPAQRTRARAYSMLLGAQIAISSGGIMARYALAGMSVATAGAVRFSLVALFMIGRLVVKKRPLLAWRDEVTLLIGGLLLAGQFASWMASISYLTVGTATVLYCTAPFWNGLYEALILRKRPPGSFWAALSVAALGVCMMVYDGSDTVSAPAHMRVFGIALALGSGMMVAAFLVLMRRLAKYDPNGDNYNPLDLSTRAYAYAALALTALSLYEGQALPPMSNWSVWAGVIGMAVITQGLGHTFQNASLRHIPASMVGFATLLEPLIATALAWVFFEEAIGVRGGVGAILVLTSLAWALARNNANQNAAAAAVPA